MISLFAALIGLGRDLIGLLRPKPVELPPEPKPLDDKVLEAIEAAKRRAGK